MAAVEVQLQESASLLHLFITEAVCCMKTEDSHFKPGCYLSQTLCGKEILIPLILNVIRPRGAAGTHSRVPGAGPVEESVRSSAELKASPVAVKRGRTGLCSPAECDTLFKGAYT